MQHRCNLAAKASGLECACVNNDDFTVLVSGGGRCYWVSMCTLWPLDSKWLSEYSNKSASHFTLSLNILPRNYSDSEGFQGWCDECSPNKTGVQTLERWSRICWKWYTFWKYHKQNTCKCWTQLSYSPDSVPCGFWLFQKTKSPLKGKRFQTIDEIQENTMGKLMAISRSVWGPKVSALKMDWGAIVLCTMFLVSSSINGSIFHSTWLDTFWRDLKCICK